MMMIDVQAVIADSPNQSLLSVLTEGNLETALSLATKMMAKDSSTPHVRWCKVRLERRFAH